MAVADARIANGVAFESELIDHASGGRSGRILENAAGAFLAKRLAGTPFFVADTNPLENFAEWLGGKFQLHREHHIIGRKRCMPVFERNLIALENFDLARGAAIDFYLANIVPDLDSVGAGIHAQGSADCAGNADQPFHAAEIMLGAEGDRSAEVGGGVHAWRMLPSSTTSGSGCASCITTQGSSPSATSRFEPPPRN